MAKFPIQPTYTDEHGTLRFRENKIVRFLLDNGGLDLNKLSGLGYPAPEFPREDWEQFAQLIGYSLSGFGDLSYVSDETYEAADAMAREGLSEKDARIQHLESIVEGLRQDVRQMAPRLFRIHLDDLQA